MKVLFILVALIVLCVFADEGGVEFFRPDGVQGYRCYAKTCVAGSNFKKIKNTNYASCAAACDAEEKCLGFEIYKNWGGKKKIFNAGDCILNSKTKRKRCRAFNLNWCEKHDDIIHEIVEYENIEDGLCPEDRILTEDECERVTNEYAIEDEWSYFAYYKINEKNKPHGCYRHETDESYGEGSPGYNIYYNTGINSGIGFKERTSKWNDWPICRFVKSEYTCAQNEGAGCLKCLENHRRTDNDQCESCNAGYLLKDYKCSKVTIMDKCPKTYNIKYSSCPYICFNRDKNPSACIKSGDSVEITRQITYGRTYCTPEMGGENGEALEVDVGSKSQYSMGSITTVLILCAAAGASGFAIAKYVNKNKLEN